jgi:hypothetical protein
MLTETIKNKGFTMEFYIFIINFISSLVLAVIWSDKKFINKLFKIFLYLLAALNLYALIRIM